ncbi:MAG TPA: MarR family transcriptional regulator [Acidimicrobiia bacterium]|nr:MarR family transcriptional regulator [Acidimicrobiia bacterium]
MTKSEPIATRPFRASSRRGTRVLYVRGVTPQIPAPPPLDDDDPARVAITTLHDAGALVSALRPVLRKAGFDPRFARLVLAFTDPLPLRVADIAWELGITTGAASRLLDAAEERGLVDKHYQSHDRRGTWCVLSARGRGMRTFIEGTIRAGLERQRKRGKAYGIRAYLAAGGE